MNYTVEWLSKAEKMLAAIWLNASNRRAVTRAAYQVDLILTTAPWTKGQEFYGDWLLEVPSLYVVYKFSQKRRTVTVLHVWYKAG